MIALNLNPYLDFVTNTHRQRFNRRVIGHLINATEIPKPRESAEDTFLIRRDSYSNLLRETFGYAIPTKNVANAIKMLDKPIGEIGGGTGYYAWYLQQQGIKIKSSDIAQPKMGWLTLEQADAVQMSEQFAKEGRAPLTVWPPAEYMALRSGDDSIVFSGDALETYIQAGGDTVIFVGEDIAQPNGVMMTDILPEFRFDEHDYGFELIETGDKKFHDLLEQRCELVERIATPRLNPLRDYVHIFRVNK